MKEIFQNKVFRIALVVGVVVILIPNIYRRVTGVPLPLTILSLFGIETSLITKKTQPPEPGRFEPRHYVVLKLEYLNVSRHPDPEVRKKVQRLVLTRFSVSQDQVGEFITDEGNYSDVLKFYENNTEWLKKTKLALAVLKKKKIEAPYWLR